MGSAGKNSGVVRGRADRIESSCGGARFRRARRLRDDDRRVVAEAAALARLGDRDAIRFLYLRYMEHLYGYVCSIVGDEHEAEDVTQQAFAKILAALPRYEPRIAPFSAWVLRIAHNVAVDHVRARRSVPFAEVRGLEHDDGDLGWERRQDLREALAQLPAAQRDVVMLRLLCGLSAEEVARRLGRSLLSVHSLHARGRRALRAELTRTHAAPAVHEPRGLVACAS